MMWVQFLLPYWFVQSLMFGSHTLAPAKAHDREASDR